ncbi:MAG: Trm112 family protein [Phreatobacter sp.]|uniref:Trm112 family protein n=1 Tax=Phreatobacter sp. TaxID=1966341 RepID=UPI00403702A4
MSTPLDPEDPRPAETKTAVPPTRPGTVDPRLLEVLVCPVTKGSLDYDAEAGELISRAARLVYPIREGIPIMLPEEARPLED